MDTKELLSKVRKIEIQTKIKSQDLFAGSYHSSFKGKGMTFSEVREYHTGDEIRTIDWNVTARYNEPYVKVFEEERELTLMLLVDVSASEGFGAVSKTKRELITYLCSILAFSANQNNDKTGLILFTGDIEKTIFPKKGKPNILRIIRELVEYEPVNKTTNLKKAISYVTQVLKKRSIVFIISDFIDKDFEKELEMCSKRHDTIAIKVYDPLEKKIPPVGLINFKNPETNETILADTSSSKFRNLYSKFQEIEDNKLEAAFKKSKIDFLKISTEEDYIKSLVGFFRSRRK